MDNIDKNEFLREQLDLLKRKQIDDTIEWQDVADFRSEYVGDLEHRDTVRKGSKLLYEYIDAGWVNEPKDNEISTTVDFGCYNEKYAIQKERYKLQTEKIEMNRWLRELARDELITEKIVNAVAALPSLEIPEYIKPLHCNQSYLVCLADCHYGIEFSIKDFFGNVINEYSPEIFEKRMWDLFNQIVEIIEEKHINEISVWELGDGIQGLLRLNSQLMQLRYGVIDSAIRYGDFLGHWLNELSKHARIKFQMTMDSNHNQLRLCGAPKNSFVDENMSKVIMLAIEKELANNPNVTIISNPTGLNFGQFSTYQVLGIHGEVRNLGDALDDYSRAYQTPISYIIGAHVHHIVEKETGINSEAISIRSMVGVDPYGISLLATSNAGASLFEFDQIKGLTCEHRLKVD